MPKPLQTASGWAKRRLERKKTQQSDFHPLRVATSSSTGTSPHLAEHNFPPACLYIQGSSFFPLWNRLPFSLPYSFFSYQHILWVVVKGVWSAGYWGNKWLFPYTTISTLKFYVKWHNITRAGKPEGVDRGDKASSSRFLVRTKVRPLLQYKILLILP